MRQPAEKRAAFRALHESGCFVIPNPWDPGSAKALAQLGFRALATTSAGFAFGRGRPDSLDSLRLEDVLAHVAEIVAATDLPVSADFQSGYAEDADGVLESVARCAQTGVAGLSIEDAAGDGSLFDPAEATTRVAAARAAVDDAGGDVLLTARAECFLVGHADPLGEAIRRLTAYSEAGADVLFAPGARAPEDIRSLVEAVSPKPLNVLIGADTGLTVADLAELGVRRISVGSALARVAWGAFLRAAEEIAGSGSFAGLDGAAPFTRLNEMLGDA
ncbi:MAG TPA: isocitrate lyase/phosphoenolpyruvate mutase family protein [Solirubrobacteraceae bacterium]|nr:isocitrate lyase/phosphoenolpyruvate mutase family protein [Solirubrobacteraceae bacterium]